MLCGSAHQKTALVWHIPAIANLAVAGLSFADASGESIMAETLR